MVVTMAQHTEDKWVSAVSNDRRRFLRLAGAAAALLVLGPLARRAKALPQYTAPARRPAGSGFVFAQLQYEGGNWEPEPGAWPSLVKELEASTSIVADPARRPLRATSPELFSHPFLYMSGDSTFKPFQEDEILRLRQYLKYGGTLLADDCGGTPGQGFDGAFRREMNRVFPDRELERLGSDHTIYRSFFLIKGMGGRKVVSPFMEGVNLGAMTPVIYCPNGLGSAWAKDAAGDWKHELSPGGERQRKLAFQTGINVIMYAMCGDYKKDRIHLPFLRMKI
jgi:hypothetical protein